MIAGRYSLDREVGRGGMGTVWLARDETLARQVAIKRVAPATAEDSHELARAEREARLAASLDHPNIVSVLDLVLEDDARWLVMEYVDGDTLSARVRRDGPLPVEVAAELVRQAADALATAHEAGIVHRDVKPSNILVTTTGQVKLTDFGIARAEADVTLTRTGVLTGSPAYLAPEVASGQSATQASDVWSLGATLFHCLAGRPPYETGDNVMGTLYRIVHEDPPRLEDPGPLGPLLEAMMAKDPARRWTMRQVVDFLQGGQVPASPVAAADVTQPLTPVAPVPAGPAGPVTPADPTPAASRGSAAGAGAAAVHTGGRPQPGGRRRSRSPVLLAVATAVVVAVVALVAFLALTRDPAPRQAAPDSGGASGSTSASPERESASESESASPSRDPAETAAAMETFVTDYLATVTNDQESAWQRLTPGFQDASGGFDRYQGFWSTIADAEVLSIEANPRSDTVSYSVRYTRQDGSIQTDDVTLQLARGGGGFLIADEA